MLNLNVIMKSFLTWVVRIIIQPHNVLGEKAFVIPRKLKNQKILKNKIAKNYLRLY